MFLHLICTPPISILLHPYFHPAAPQSLSCRYDFRNAFVPARVSFRPRLSDGCGVSGYWCGATKWQFIGSNDEKCGRYSKWTVLCEDLSGKHFERMGQSKYCTVDDAQTKAFRCLGISVLDTSYPGVSEVSLGGIKMWQKVLVES